MSPMGEHSNLWRGRLGTQETTAMSATPEPAERDRTRGVAHEVGVDLAALPTDRTYDGEPLVTAEGRS